MLTLRNLQRAVPLRRARLRRDVETLRLILGIRRFDLGLVCVDDRRIRTINQRYRNRNQPTDVLAFPFHQDVRPGTVPCPVHREDLNLGDIFLGVESVMRQCQEDSAHLHGALTVVTLHGICHLLGYGHETENEWTEMFQMERSVLSEFNRLTGQQLEPLTDRRSPDM